MISGHFVVRPTSALIMTSENSEGSSPPSSPTRPTNDDFVSADVNEALQEARRILTKSDTHNKQQDERILDESTTVRFTRTGRTRHDPVEVFVSRSTIVTQKESDEESEDFGVLRAVEQVHL